MKKVILFGASGHVGRKVAEELARQHFELTVVIRNNAKAHYFKDIQAKIVNADVLKPDSLRGICHGQDVVISTLGKSVSPNDWSKPTFRQVDLEGNVNILNEAQKSGVKKFIYLSAFHAEKYPDLNYFAVHEQFSMILINSGIDYSVIKPPAIYSAFLDMIDLASKGRLVSIGSGEFKTNPIYEGDLAKIIVDNIHQTNSIVEAGGKNIYSRIQMLEIIQQNVNPANKIQKLPLKLVKMVLPVLSIINKNAYDKFAFFLKVMNTDTLAPQIGEQSFEEYIKDKIAFDHN
ncbi:MAG: SDR family oxidoreductase [Cytophagaceae bacterium]|nr:SDR family oxidoreductase [Cytophagaceae bacterium]MBL0326109.1 SDR family oxidoreductase [Cytophagaceae bacterium]